MSYFLSYHKIWKNKTIKVVIDISQTYMVKVKTYTKIYIFYTKNSNNYKYQKVLRHEVNVNFFFILSNRILYIQNFIKNFKVFINRANRELFFTALEWNLSKFMQNYFKISCKITIYY